MRINNWLHNNNLIVALLILVFLLLGFMFIRTHNQYPSISLAQVAKDIAYGDISHIIIQNDSSEIIVAYKLGHVPSVAVSMRETGLTLYEALRKYGVTQGQLQKIEVIVQTPSLKNSDYETSK